jgi:hypothetical protein
MLMVYVDYYVNAIMRPTAHVCPYAPQNLAGWAAKCRCSTLLSQLLARCQHHFPAVEQVLYDWRSEALMG